MFLKTKKMIENVYNKNPAVSQTTKMSPFSSWMHIGGEGRGGWHLMYPLKRL
jgi:hypothetical protein